MVATPHVRRDFVTEPLELPERVRELRDALAAARIPLGVHCGGELGHDLVGTLGQAQLEAIAQGPAGEPLAAGGDPVRGDHGRGFHAATAELRERGFAVVIAHPERSAVRVDRRASRALRSELAAGSVAQVNAMSLTGRHGEEAHARRARVRGAGASSRIVASDAHGAARPPSLRPAWAALIDAGVPTARRLGASRAKSPRSCSRNGVRTRVRLAA